MRALGSMRVQALVSGQRSHAATPCAELDERARAHGSSRAGSAPPDRSDGGRGLKRGARARPVRCGVRAAASHNSLCAKL